MDFHHVGIAAHDADAAVSRFEAALGTPVIHAEQFDGLEVRFLAVDGAYLEILEPLSAGPVARFLDREGPGIHHVAFETPNIPDALDRASAAGVELVDEEPRPGAWDHQVAFLHPNSFGGVLVELVQT